MHTAEERQKTGSNHKLNQPYSRIYMKVLEEMEKICELIEQCSYFQTGHGSHNNISIDSWRTAQYQEVTSVFIGRAKTQNAHLTQPWPSQTMNCNKIMGDQELEQLWQLQLRKSNWELPQTYTHASITLFKAWMDIKPKYKIKLEVLSEIRVS